jgi:hypothetical protein
MGIGSLGFRVVLGFWRLGVRFSGFEVLEVVGCGL